MSTALTMIGNLTKDAVAGEGNQPAKFRMAAYCTGKGDDAKSAFIGVKVFDIDPAELAKLTKGTRVIVTGRLDPWETKEGSQVIDMVAEHVGICLYRNRKDGADNGRSARPAQSRPAARAVAPAADYPDEDY